MRSPYAPTAQVILLAGLLAIPGFQAIATAQQDTLRIAYSLTTLRAIDPQDAEKATNVFAGVIAQKKQMDLAVDTRVFVLPISPKKSQRGGYTSSRSWARSIWN